MKNLKSIKNFFPHDSGARNDDKLMRVRMRHGAAGYGVFFMLLERLREESNYCSTLDYDMFAFDFREPAEMIRSVVEDFGLFEFSDDGESFYSNNFLKRMEIKDSASDRMRAAANARWGRKASANEEMQSEDASVCNENAAHNEADTDASTRKEEKRKEEKRKKSTARERKGNAQRSAASVAPSLEEVKIFLKEASLNADAAMFINYYEARGWQVDGEQVHDWRALLRVWASREKKQFSASSTKPVSGISKELEAINASEKRKAAEDKARKEKELAENPDGLSSAQILAQAKKRLGISPDKSITSIQ